MRAARSLTRRDAMLAGAVALAGGRARADASPRVASLDWGWTATLIALGAVPVGAAERRAYTAWVATPPLPAATAELGLRAAPSLDTLAALRPDLILTNSLDAPIRPMLERIAPTLDNPTFTAARTPLADARAAARLLGDRIGRREAAETLVADIEARLAAAAARLAGRHRRPLVPIQVADRRHLTVYGPGSLFADVLAALGLLSGFPGPTGLWGAATLEVTRLAEMPAADLLLLDPVPPGAGTLVEGPNLLTALLAVTGRRLLRLPPAWAYGDLTAAARFGDLVADALLRDDARTPAAPA